MPIDLPLAPPPPLALRQSPVTRPTPTTSGPQAPQEQPSYYDVSMLKPPTWRWQIASYFFLGGLSAGSYLLARMAERFGGEQFREVTRTGTAVAALAAAPCAPLLITDLGDPSRFHHMLRVFKPWSPMNLGAWTLTGYSGTVALALLREWARGRGERERSLVGRLTDGLVVTITDLAGIPLALMMAGYTGVLLSGSATPVWSKNRWLGPLFSASAISTGAAAISLALHARRQLRHLPLQESTPGSALATIDLAAHVAEALTLSGFLTEAGGLAKPLIGGEQARNLWGSVLGMVASEGVKHLPLPRRASGWGKMAAAALGLAGGFALRWAFVHAGPVSAKDPEAARQASRPR